MKNLSKLSFLIFDIDIYTHTSHTQQAEYATPCQSNSDCTIYSPSRNGNNNSHEILVFFHFSSIHIYLTILLCFSGLSHIYIYIGINNGVCTNGTCEIFSWCPLEVDSTNATHNNILPEAANFTIFIKNNIVFEEFNVVRTNVGIGNTTAAYLTTCTWDPVVSLAERLLLCTIFL